MPQGLNLNILWFLSLAPSLTDMRPCRDPDVAMGTPVLYPQLARADHAAHAPISSRPCRRSACPKPSRLYPRLSTSPVFLSPASLISSSLSTPPSALPSSASHASLAAFTFPLTFLPNVRPNCPYTVGRRSAGTRSSGSSSFPERRHLLHRDYGSR